MSRNAYLVDVMIVFPGKDAFWNSLLFPELLKAVAVEYFLAGVGEAKAHPQTFVSLRDNTKRLLCNLRLTGIVDSVPATPGE